MFHDRKEEIDTTSHGCPKKRLDRYTKRSNGSFRFRLNPTIGYTRENPAESCADIPVGGPDGLYWIRNQTDNNVSRVYCYLNGHLTVEKGSG